MSKLPPSWKMVRLADVCDVNPRDPGPSKRSALVSFIPMPAVSDREGIILEHNTKSFAAVAKGYTRFREEDVIFAKITPCMENGKIAVARDLHSGFACGSTEFHVLRSKGTILPQYLWYFLRHKSFRVDAERHMTGAVGQRRVPTQYIKDAAVPLPPLCEQHNIIAKLDSLFKRSKSAREDLTRIPRLIERYKQAVVKAAYSEAETAATEITTLGAVAEEIRNGVSRRPENAPPGIPVLKISALRSMAVRMDERRYYVPEKDEDVSRYELQAGDLLFTRYNGNPDLVANCGMVRILDEQLIYPDKLIRVRINRKLADPEFVEAISASPQARAALAPFIKSAAGQHGISGADLKQLPIPLPSKTHQHQIITRIKHSFSAIDRFATECSRAASLLDRLDQATLDKAFQGDLLPHANGLAAEVEQRGHEKQRSRRQA